MSTAQGSGDTDALQTALAAEHAAVWLYGLLGARTSVSEQPALADALRQAYAVHRTRRDGWTALLRDDGVEPVAAAPSYVAPDLATGDPVAAVASVRTAAIDAETTAAETYAFLVGSTTGERRRTAVAALRDAAVRVVALGGAPTTTPGA